MSEPGVPLRERDEALAYSSDLKRDGVSRPGHYLCQGANPAVLSPADCLLAWMVAADVSGRNAMTGRRQRRGPPDP